MKITIDAEIGRPIDGEESAKLASQIGIVTRDVIATHVKWREFDKNELNPGLDRIKVYMYIIIHIHILFFFYSYSIFLLFFLYGRTKEKYCQNFFRLLLHII